MYIYIYIHTYAYIYIYTYTELPPRLAGALSVVASKPELILSLFITRRASALSCASFGRLRENPSISLKNPSFI